MSSRSYEQKIFFPTALTAVADDSASEANSPATLSSEKAELDLSNPETFELLVKQHIQTVYNYLLSLTHNVHDAEDLTQETFLKAYLHLHQFRENRSFQGWLLRIARRTFLNSLRKRVPIPIDIQQTSQLETSSPWQRSSDSSTSEASLVQEEAAWIWEIAHQLPRKMFEVLWLHYGENLEIAEVAQVLGFTQVHVRVLLHRARKRLQKLLLRSSKGREILQNRKETDQ